MSNTDRIFKAWKSIVIPFTGITSTQALLNQLGQIYNDISDVNWQRVVMEVNLTTLTGTSPTINFSGLTTNDQTNGGASTDAGAVKADGSTSFSSGTLSATGRYQVATGKIASTGASASNIGKFLGILGTVGGTVTGCAGTIIIYLEGQ